MEYKWWRNPAPNPVQKVLRIGGMLCMDSSHTNYKITRLMQQAYELYLDQINREEGGVLINGERYFVELVLGDDRSLDRLITPLYNELTAKQGINLILGPYGSGLAERLAKLAEDKPVLVMMPGAGVPEVFQGDGRSNVFGTLTPSSQYLLPPLQMAALFNDWSDSRAAYIFENNVFGKSACSGVEYMVVNQTLLLPANRVMRIMVPDNAGGTAGDLSIKATVAKLSRWQPEIVIGCVYPDVCKRLLFEMREQDLCVKMIIMTICVGMEDFIPTTREAGAYVVGTTPWVATLRGPLEGSFYPDDPRPITVLHN